MPAKQHPPIVAALSTPTFLQPSLMALESIGLCYRQALTEIGCCIEEFEKGDIDFLDVQHRLLVYGHRASGNALFAVYAGSFVKLEHLGMLGLLFKSGLTLKDAADQAIRFLPALPEPFSTLQVRLTQNQIEIELPSSVDEYSSSLLAVEYLFSFIYRCTPLISGWPAQIDSLRFSHTPTTCISKYEAYFQSKVLFNAGANICTMRLDARKPLRFSNPILFLELESMLSRLASHTAGDYNKVVEIRKLIASEASTRRPTEHQVAKRLSVSKSTLRRWLSTCGTTFQKELDITMREQATQMLNDGNGEIKNIAAQLGYSDPSAFHRAFKRWTGVTPAQFKNMNRP